jgi:hypothetical protein
MISFQRTTSYPGGHTATFVADKGSIVRDTGRQIDWDLLDERYYHGAEAITATEPAVATDTTITVAALPVDVPAGTILDFGPGTLAEVTVDADAGDTTLTVTALDAGIADNAVAYIGSGLAGGKQVPGGTVMDLLASGKIVPSALATGGVTAYCILETNADEDSDSDAATGYGCIRGGALFENLLPEATGSPAVIDSTWKTELRARGGAFLFEQYEDDTV